MTFMVVLLLGILFAPAASVTPPIVGQWESMAISTGGIGNAVDFAPDGSFTSTIGAMVDFTYRESAGKLTTVFVDPATGKRDEQSTAIRIEGETLFEKDGNGPGKDVRMQRIRSGRAGDPPIVGVWSYAHYTGPTAFVTFTRDGRQLFRLPMKSDGGTWEVAGDSLTMVQAGQPAQKFTYTIRDGVLTLTDSSGKERRYRRAVTLD